jgi:hypothetical protein
MSLPVSIGQNIPLKCCSNLISRNARLARIFLLKTFVTFLIATPSPDWTLVAALHNISYLSMTDPISWVSPDDTVSALTQLLCHIVSFVDHKLLIENLEDLAPLKRICRHGVQKSQSKTCKRGLNSKQRRGVVG